MNTEICVRLKEERERLGLIQQQLADIGGVTKTTLFNYENGREPSSGFLSAIAAAGADTRYILEGEYRYAEIGGRLRKERTRLNKNIKDMAELGCITPELQTRYEQGIERPSADYLNWISKAGAETWYILTGELPPDDPRHNQDEQALINNYRRCSPEMKNAILLMARNSAR